MMFFPLWVRRIFFNKRIRKKIPVWKSYFFCGKKEMCSKTETFFNNFWTTVRFSVLLLLVFACLNFGLFFIGPSKSDTNLILNHCGQCLISFFVRFCRTSVTSSPQVKRHHEWTRPVAGGGGTTEKCHTGKSGHNVILAPHLHVFLALKKQKM